jgi:hypothetical protein
MSANYAEITLNELRAKIIELRRQEKAHKDTWEAAQKQEREAFCQLAPNEPGCGPNPLGIKDVVNLFGNPAEEHAEAKEAAKRAYQRYVSTANNLARAEAALAAREIGNEPHPSTLDTSEPEDIKPLKTKEVPCELFATGYERCERYGYISELFGVNTPFDCRRPVECRHERQKKIAVISGLGISAVIALVWRASR